MGCVGEGRLGESWQEARRGFSKKVKKKKKKSLGRRMEEAGPWKHRAEGQLVGTEKVNTTSSFEAGSAEDRRILRIP